MARAKIGRKPLTKKQSGLSSNFWSNNWKYFLIAGVVVVLFLVIFLPVYFLVIKKDSGSGGGGGGSSGYPGDLSSKIVASWVNAQADPPVFDQVLNHDLIMLASYSPSHISTLYDCTSVYSMFPNDFSALQSLVATAHTKAKQVLLSVGGSSFGEPEWQDLLYKYTGPMPTQPPQDCQCPGKSWWQGCDDSSSCTGTIFNIKTLDGTSDCCNNQTSNHRCCCPEGSIVTTVDGKTDCIPKPTKPGPTKPLASCNYYGIIPGKEQILKNCLADPTKSASDKHLCLQQNTDPVIAYATCLNATGADGIDFDFESPDPQGILSIALIKFAKELKAYMLKTYNKKIYISITPLSGDAYAKMYQGVYNSLQSADCPFDYAIPMLYNGGQYPYGTPDTRGFTWNGLLDNWRTKYMAPSPNKNTKLIAAFIEYYKCGSRPFKCDEDLTIFINQYILNTPQDGGSSVDGIAYFYYSTDYDIKLLNQNLSKSMNCFKNSQCNFICEPYVPPICPTTTNKS